MKWFPTHLPPDDFVTDVQQAISDLEDARARLCALVPKVRKFRGCCNPGFNPYICHNVNGNREVMCWITHQLQLGDDIVGTLYVWVRECSFNNKKDPVIMNLIPEGIEMLNARIRWIDWMINSLKSSNSLRRERNEDTD